MPVTIAMDECQFVLFHGEGSFELIELHPQSADVALLQLFLFHL